MTRLATCDDPIARLLASATLAVTNVVLSESATEALMDAVRDSRPLPPEWGMSDSHRATTTADIALEVVHFARFDHPAERATRLLEVDSSGDACSAAFQMTFVTPKADFPYGPVLSELSEHQLQVLRHAANASRGNFEALGIGRFAIGRFLDGRGFAYRQLPLVVDGARWVMHFGAVVRRVAIGGLMPEVAARSLVEATASKELLGAFLTELAVVSRLHPSPEERGRVEALFAAVLGELRERDLHLRERLGDALAQAHRFNSVPAHVAVALHFMLVEYGEWPTEHEPHVVRALRDAGARGPVRALLECLPVDHRERLVLRSDARTHADLCLTRTVLDWLLSEATEENAEETLGTLSRGTEETRGLLVTMRCERELAETVRVLAEEALQQPARGVGTESGA